MLGGGGRRVERRRLTHERRSVMQERWGDRVEIVSIIKGDGRRSAKAAS